MATIDFGAGYPAYPDLASAVAAAGAGGTVRSWGPHTDTVGVYTWPGALSGITWLHMGGGDYTFDGGLATLDCLRIDGTGNTLVLLNADGTRVKIKGYGRYVFWVNAAGNVINDPYLFDNGYVAAGHIRPYMLYANSTIHRPVIASGLDNQAYQYGLYISNSNGGLVTDLYIANVNVTGTGRVYAVLSSGSCGRVLIDGVILENCSSVAPSYPLSWGGTGAGDVMRVRRAQIRSLTGPVNSRIGYAYQKGIDIENFIFDNCGGDGFVFQAPSAFVGDQNRVVNGVIRGMSASGVSANQLVAGSAPTIRNVIARDCVGNGFVSYGTFDPDSDHNVAYNNGTDYSGWTKGANDLEAVDPLQADPANGDYTLLSDSPCIGTGETIAGMRYDIGGIERPQGANFDIGPHEYPAEVIDLVNKFAVATGSAGTIVAGENTFSDAAADFQLPDANHKLYIYNCIAANAGLANINSVDSATQVVTDKTFSTDPQSGSIKWALFLVAQ